jgi:hypothetical protein
VTRDDTWRRAEQYNAVTRPVTTFLLAHSAAPAASWREFWDEFAYRVTKTNLSRLTRAAERDLYTRLAPEVMSTCLKRWHLERLETEFRVLYSEAISAWQERNGDEDFAAPAGR